VSNDKELNVFEVPVIFERAVPFLPFPNCQLVGDDSANSNTAAMGLKAVSAPVLYV
jgi:hypothetical protein